MQLCLLLKFRRDVAVHVSYYDLTGSVLGFIFQLPY